MRAELKSVDSPDAPGGDTSAYKPDDSNEFGLTITATIGPAGEAGGELFTFTVCSPRWLNRQPLPKGFAFQRHTLLLDHWDPDLVERALRDLCHHTTGEDWHEIAQKLSRYGYWEFEDYRCCRSVPPRCSRASCWSASRACSSHLRHCRLSIKATLGGSPRNLDPLCLASRRGLCHPCER